VEGKFPAYISAFIRRTRGYQRAILLGFEKKLSARALETSAQKNGN
jgi:hypothetical protein